MKKRTFTRVAALLLGMTLVLPACNTKKESSSPVEPESQTSESQSDSQSESSSQAQTYVVTISNKQELQAEWPAGSEGRKINISTEPRANIAELIRDGTITITSSDNEIVSISGQMANPVAKGKATITVRCGESSDSVELTVAEALPVVVVDYGTEQAPLSISQVLTEVAKLNLDNKSYSPQYFFAKAKLKTAVTGSATSAKFTLTDGEKDMDVSSGLLEEGKDTSDYKIDDILTIRAYVRADSGKTNGFYFSYNQGGAANKQAPQVIAYEDGGGTPIEVHTYEVTVAEALTACNAQEDGGTTTDLYKVSGIIKSVRYHWSEEHPNVSFYMVDSLDDTDSLYVYSVNCTQEVDAKVLPGAEVTVTGNLQKYVSGTTVTPELIGGRDFAITKEASAAQDVTDVDAVATVKTVAEVKAYTAADQTLIAKVTGVAENLYSTKYGNFYLVDPQTGDAIVVYGGYTNVSFEVASGIYSVKEKTGVVTSAIIGHTVTVYATIGFHSGAGQLVDGKVVDGAAYTGNVAASVAVNDDTMGSATLSATSAAYGTEITVTPTANTGYVVEKVEVKRASQTEVLEADNDAYKFNAQIKNEVIVTFKESGETPVEPESFDLELTYANLGLDTNNTYDKNKNRDVTVGDYTLTLDPGSKGIVTGNKSNPFTADKIGLAIQLKKSAGDTGIQFKTAFASGSTVKMKFYATYATEGLSYLPSLKIGDGQAFGPSNQLNSDNKVEGTKTEYTMSTSSGTFDVYEYILEYDISSLQNSTLTILNASSASYITSIGINFGEGQQQEVAQPVGNFSGYAVNALDDSNVFVTLALANEKAFLEVGDLAKITTTYAFDKTTGVVTITDATLGTVTAKFDEANNALTEVTVSGTAAAMIKNNGEITLNGAAKFWNLDGTTAELREQFIRRYRAKNASSWTVDNNEEHTDRIVSDTTNFVAGTGAMSVRPYPGDGNAVGISLKADFAEKTTFKNIGFWVYNSSDADITLRTWVFQQTGLAGAAEIGQMTAKANGWTYCRMGFNYGMYNFNISNWNGSANALVFDNIALF